MRAVENIIAVGDSNAHGHGATLHQGWLQQLEVHYRRAYASNPVAEFFNLTVPAESAETFATRAAYIRSPNSLWHRPSRHTLSVVALGQNGPSNNIKQGRPANDLEPFTAFFTSGIRHLLELGDVLYVGFAPPNVWELAHGDAWDMGRRRQSFLRFETAACDIVGKEAASAGRLYGIVPLYELVEHDPLYGHASDGVHPNDQGYELIFDIVRPIFDDLAGISDIR